MYTNIFISILFWGKVRDSDLIMLQHWETLGLGFSKEGGRSCYFLGKKSGYVREVYQRLDVVHLLGNFQALGHKKLSSGCLKL